MAGPYPTGARAGWTVSVPRTAPIPAHPITKPSPTAPKPRSVRITVGKTAPRMAEPINQMWVLQAKGARWGWR